MYKKVIKHNYNQKPFEMVMPYVFLFLIVSTIIETNLKIIIIKKKNNILNVLMIIIIIHLFQHNQL